MNMAGRKGLRTSVLADKAFKMAIEAAFDHVIITDPDGKVLYANRSVERTTGYPREEVIGSNPKLWGRQMPPAFYETLWRTIKTEKRPFVGELRNRRKDGTLYDVEANISPVLDERGEVVYFIGTERDITKVKEADRAKTEFVSIASHELRTPLAGIAWQVESLLGGDLGETNQEQKQFLENVHVSVRNMTELIDALLSSSRIELGTFVIEPEPVDLEDLIEESVLDMSGQAKAKRLRVDFVVAGNIPRIPADRKLMRMVIENLISNAVKYTPSGGKVMVALSVSTGKETVGEHKPSKGSILIKVVDSGYGIPRSEQGKIFSRMYRAENVRKLEIQGTGLGLFVVKSVVEFSGGEIWFESEEGKGTAFYVTFPRIGMGKREGAKKLA